ncbi:hypothetical protein FOXG_15594 [Fusarium oxysporum f. sp. lycopersici 4287]|uniref:Uncharacterized protein n=1 Tax=Fusarium oxysporum f. sp. lycopersici (strain 4287 / CBS 123668 / FGSC 9935 / NRRL 34936) TaxID=426428 RepID=A0A0J9W498_FUSO4|nr:hypothetical protein FOXG_15594 [Fusarium oxysporum f. sp. lycopersici 4287]KNB17874.1 hypothetical protein FOXG_15594 [Fusarium oxysporum f. sp. lycopersici 4287]
MHRDLQLSPEQYSRLEELNLHLRLPEGAIISSESRRAPQKTRRVFNCITNKDYLLNDGVVALLRTATYGLENAILAAPFQLEISGYAIKRNTAWGEKMSPLLPDHYWKVNCEAHLGFLSSLEARKRMHGIRFLIGSIRHNVYKQFTTFIWDRKKGKFYHFDSFLPDQMIRLSNAILGFGEFLAAIGQNRARICQRMKTPNPNVSAPLVRDPSRELAFSPDGQRLASATHDGFIKIWDARMGGCQATLELDKNEEDEYIFHFEKTGARLRTNIGTFDLSLLPSSPPAALPASSPRHHLLQCQGYGISSDRSWITYEGRNLLWLPPEYRPVTLAIMASTVVLGCKSGLVLLFRFSEA